MDSFFTALAVGAFVAVARMANRVFAIGAIALVAVLTWRYTEGGSLAVEALIRDSLAFLASQRKVAAGLVLGLLVGRPFTTILHSHKP